MKLFVYTQVSENYGDENRPHWKNKGGDTYCIANLTYAQAAELGNAGLAKLVSEAAKKIECNEDFIQEYILDWSLEEDDFVTHDEQLQLEYDGKITYPHKDMTAVMA